MTFGLLALLETLDLIAFRILEWNTLISAACLIAWLVYVCFDDVGVEIIDQQIGDAQRGRPELGDFCLGLWLDGENAALAIEMELHFATSLL